MVLGAQLLLNSWKASPNANGLNLKLQLEILAFYQPFKVHFIACQHTRCAEKFANETCPGPKALSFCKATHFKTCHVRWIAKDDNMDKKIKKTIQKTQEDKLLPAPFSTCLY